MQETVIKLTRQQLETMKELYEQFVVAHKPCGAAERLVHTIQLQVYVKLRKLDVEYKQRYKLKLTAAEEQAFMMYWSSFQFSVTTFAGHIIQSAISAIHPKYV